MSIPDSVIEEVRLRADILEILGEHTRLKRSGRTFRGPCPLHGGEGPNFSVDPAKGIFKCFVCGEGGDIFSFLRKHLGMSYPDAVRAVAERVGVEIPERRARAAPDPHAHLYEVMALFAGWFKQNLWERKEGERAREYLKKRGISKQAAERFGLGWAPAAHSAVQELARAHGIALEALFEVGLLRESSTTPGQLFPLFRERLIFPIEDLGGRVLAFGGRLLGPADRFKYINSPETPIYAKGRGLYGLGWSRGAVRKKETALVVEGYMDYVSLASHGVENAVAPLGTAMTPQQAELIARYAKRVILLYDSDKAGLRATFRSGDELLRAGVEVLVATLPEGEDPDSLVREKGGDELRRYLDDAIDVFERKLQLLERRSYFESVAGTRRAIDALLPTVRAASDELLRGVYLRRLAEKTGVPQATLEKEVAGAAEQATQSAPPPPSRSSGGTRTARVAVVPSPAALGVGPERNLLLLLLRDESWVERAARELGPEDFRNPIYRSIFEGLLQVEGSRDPEGTWLELFSPEALRVVEELRGDPEGEHLTAPEQFFTASLRGLLMRPFEERLTAISREMPNATPERQEALYREKLEITRTMRERNLPLKEGMLRRGAPAP
ncbi:MAG: DNA primase [Longimicrobiaceae bacterium]